ncbi:MAG: hypothetical protein U0575_10820 [Phycisphaerales bacterium]
MSTTAAMLAVAVTATWIAPTVCAVERAAFDRAGVDPARPDPARSDPVRSDPARPDPVRSDPARSDGGASDRRTPDRASSAGAPGSKPAGKSAPQPAPSVPVAQESVEELTEVAAPFVVRVRLADGVAITGTVTAWSRNGVVGSFGYRRWTDLRPADTAQLFQRLMNAEDAGDWVALGRVLLLSPGGAGLAETMFRRARAIDRAVEPQIAAARQEAARSAATEAAPDPDRLRLDDPEGRTYPAAPWRALTPSEARGAVELLRDDAEAVLSLAGIPAMAPVESEHLLIYSDLPRAQTAQLAVQLERVVADVRKSLATRSAAPDPWGKIVIFITSDRAEFRRLQQRVFLQVDKPDATAMCHCIGAKVVVVAFARSSGPDLHVRLATQLVHGLLHRHVSALRLPPWANEGLAQHFAARAAPEFFELVARRRDAMNFMRNGGDVARIVNSGYHDPGWPGPAVGTPALGMEGVGPSVGRIIVDAMMLERPAQFAAWVEAVKRGQEWREALKEVFGIPLARLVGSVVEHHRFND